MYDILFFLEVTAADRELINVFRLKYSLRFEIALECNSISIRSRVSDRARTFRYISAILCSAWRPAATFPFPLDVAGACRIDRRYPWRSETALKGHGTYAVM